MGSSVARPAPAARPRSARNPEPAGEHGAQGASPAAPARRGRCRRCRRRRAHAVVAAQVAEQRRRLVGARASDDSRPGLGRVARSAPGGRCSLWLGRDPRGAPLPIATFTAVSRLLSSASRMSLPTVARSVVPGEDARVATCLVKRHVRHRARGPCVRALQREGAEVFCGETPETQACLRAVDQRERTPFQLLARGRDFSRFVRGGRDPKWVRARVICENTARARGRAREEGRRAVTGCGCRIFASAAFTRVVYVWYTSPARRRRNRRAEAVGGGGRRVDVGRRLLILRRRDTPDFGASHLAFVTPARGPWRLRAPLRDPPAGHDQQSSRPRRSARHARARVFFTHADQSLESPSS